VTTRILDYVRQHAIAVLALVCSILALAGSSYAAFTINGSQIVNHTITPSKFSPKFINGDIRAWAVVDPNGHVEAGAGGPQAGATGVPGDYEILWRVPIPGRCATVASIDAHLSSFVAGFAVASTVGRPRKRNFGPQTVVDTYNRSGQPTPLAFDIAVIC
jgi:hypothetical protein